MIPFYTMLISMAAKEIAPIAINLVSNAVDSNLQRRAQSETEKWERLDALIGTYTMIAFSDGVIEDAELEIFYASFAPLKREEIDKKIKQYVDSPCDIRNVASTFFKKTDRINVYRTSYSIAIVGDITEQEKQTLHHFALAFGLSNDEILQIEGDARTSIENKVKEISLASIANQKGGLFEKFQTSTSSASEMVAKGISPIATSLLSNINKDSVRNVLNNSLNKFNKRR